MADIIAKDITESQALSLVDNIFEYYIEMQKQGKSWDSLLIESELRNLIKMF